MDNIKRIVVCLLVPALFAFTSCSAINRLSFDINNYEKIKSILIDDKLITIFEEAEAEDILVGGISVKKVISNKEQRLLGFDKKTYSSRSNSYFIVPFEDSVKNSIGNDKYVLAGRFKVDNEGTIYFLEFNNGDIILLENWIVINEIIYFATSIESYLVNNKGKNEICCFEVKWRK